MKQIWLFYPLENCVFFAIKVANVFEVDIVWNRGPVSVAARILQSYMQKLPADHNRCFPKSRECHSQAWLPEIFAMIALSAESFVSSIQFVHLRKVMKSLHKPVHNNASCPVSVCNCKKETYLISSLNGKVSTELNESSILIIPILFSECWEYGCISHVFRIKSYLSIDFELKEINTSVKGSCLNWCNLIIVSNLIKLQIRVAMVFSSWLKENTTEKKTLAHSFKLILKAYTRKIYHEKMCIFANTEWDYQECASPEKNLLNPIL